MKGFLDEGVEGNGRFLAVLQCAQGILEMRRAIVILPFPHLPDFLLNYPKAG